MKQRIPTSDSVMVVIKVKVFEDLMIGIFVKFDFEYDWEFLHWK